MNNANFSKRDVYRYSCWTAHAVQHSVPLTDIIYQTRLYHGDDFANAVECRVKTMME